MSEQNRNYGSSGPTNTQGSESPVRTSSEPVSWQKCPELLTRLSAAGPVLSRALALPLPFFSSRDKPASPGRQGLALTPLWVNLAGPTLHLTGVDLLHECWPEKTLDTLAN